MYVAGINFESVADGDGVRVVVYVSGCKHGCKGCHNPSSHSFTAGQPFTPELQDEMISYIENTPFVSGLTLSGGDPVYSATEVKEFLQLLKTRIPTISVWMYTGFTYEEIFINPEQSSLLTYCDVIVDGEFILEQRDMTLCYRGSRNQRIIDVKASLESGKVVELSY